MNYEALFSSAADRPLFEDAAAGTIMTCNMLVPARDGVLYWLGKQQDKHFHMNE